MGILEIIFTTYWFISNLSIFRLITQRDVSSINRLTLIQKMTDQCDEND
jgi:hypothetical protein